MGMFISDTTPSANGLGHTIERAQWAESAGMHSGWVPYVPWSLDASVVLTAVGRETNRIELGTAVVPTYPFHPQAMARSALSVNAAIGNRFTLGIGPSHPSVIEHMYGYEYDRPGVHTREYVEALHAAWTGNGHAAAAGEFFNYQSIFSVPGDPAVPGLLIAALAPYMLRLAAERADGTILWLADETAVSDHVVPRLRAAADAAGRPAPRVVLGMPIALCDDENDGRTNAARIFGAYAQIPTYARILERGAGSSPGQVVLVGNEEAVAARLRRFGDIGVTDLLAAPFAWGENKARIHDRTREFLAAVVQEAATW